MKPLRVHPEAEAELSEAVEWHEAEKVGLGRQLYEAVYDAFRAIQRSPERGFRTKRSRYLYRQTDRFQYVIYYLDLDDAVWIAAVAHQRRRPGYWRHRRPN